jgi:Domain of unknown function (DUF4389)
VSTFTYDVEYQESRSRLTVAFRYFLAIPHSIVVGLWGIFAQLLAFIQWFIIVFTGNRNEGLWKMQESYLGYSARVSGYTNLLFDQYPAFGTDPGQVPVRSSITYEPSGNRLTTGLRFLWIIPAEIVAFIVGIGGAVVVIITWFAIVITGNDPRNMWDFVLKVLRFSLQLQAYALLMTDVYPKFGEGAMTAVPSAPSPSAFPSTSPPPPPPPPSSPVPPPPPLI